MRFVETTHTLLSSCTISLARRATAASIYERKLQDTPAVAKTSRSCAGCALHVRNPGTKRRDRVRPGGFTNELVVALTTETVTYHTEQVLVGLLQYSHAHPERNKGLLHFGQLVCTVVDFCGSGELQVIRHEVKPDLWPEFHQEDRYG
jgi:hypothetical protein